MEQNKKPPIEVPHDRLSPDILEAVIENFILREGTDYGMHEVAHATKITQVRKQLERGEVVITYDEETESITLLTKHQWKKLNP